MNIKVRRPNVEALFREVDNFIPKKEQSQPPRIGISANRKDGLSCIAETYVQSVLMAGGAPVLIPVITDIKALSTIIRGLDGLLMSGGSDINPLYLGEEPIPELQDVDSYRDEYDLIILRLAFNYQIPIMGICRGHQIMNVAFGGGLYQDIYAGSEMKLLKHSQTLARELPSHTVTLINGNTKLRSILKESDIQVNSIHHQAITEPAPEFISTAIAPDGINEGMEHPEYSILSVQWHPEAMASNGDELMLELFRYHVEESRSFSQAKEIHQRILTIDSHTDTPMVFPGSFNLGEKEGGKVNLPFMEEGRIDAAFMVAYIPQGKRDDASLKAATEYAIERLEQVKKQELLNPERMEIAYTADDLIRLKHLDKKAIFLGIENGYAIGKDIRNLTLFKEMGVSYMTLCHNGSNDICDSARGEAEWNGLSPFGKEVVKEMNRLGMIIDISHAAESTFYDVLKESSQPIITSHSSARALCDHPRNLSDEQIKALAAHGGVIQVCLYKGFINKEEEKASLSDAIRHINHIVEVAGIDHVGIGSDFDGDGELIGCRASNELINITVRLLQAGYTEQDIRKIWGENLLRVMRMVNH
ncbi:membrane dipeptidase [Parabacteroides sp. PF5-5]|uniref:gamma-glutamyl-gamma-aminobutyrate hydrolase family protein n=1 Tax=unclassified Parabacteroides TaxID=2649774 RepID=UPI0024771B25|nr:MULTISPECIES: gamma-glutamyl-gamma-aminobutyrate hydrolase family protein [unclassified Parabacteroides]MDH6303416.1 membrane dipeptidase [Parabacteroides sp. PH5-39]MDH6314739.1 membrane dipeptidase [Parabacteroides sp. PF5-13]MDH6318076.1 membrane dipeptidase [Parabacteroides sp. PH5-13]MDH6321993.1 membrane dipeptidase [Parabacteroides sp. PH5-8]MDH6326116.1 membrane dipeptidase [Parabacteroides sp. PH5-41]